MRQVTYFLVWLLGGWIGCLHAQVPLAFEEGKHYQRAPAELGNHEAIQALQRTDKNPVQVLEFFSYGCSWCYKLEPYATQWLRTLPQGVSFQRVPVEFQPSWRLLSKAYYTQIYLKNLDKLHGPLFEAVQTDKLNNLSDATIQDFFVAHQVKAADFTQAYESFEVDRQQKSANTLSRAYRISAVPTIVVQGPQGIFMTSIRMAGSEEQLFKVINYLIKLQQLPPQPQ